MSWKIRRAHYYSRQRGEGTDSQVAKWLNLLFLISFIFSIVFIVQALGNENDQVEFLLVVGGLSIFTTPILFLFFLGGIQHGLPLPPNLANSKITAIKSEEKYKRSNEVRENKFEKKSVPDGYYQSEEYKKFCEERRKKFNQLVEKGEIPEGDIQVGQAKYGNVFYGKQGGRYRIRYNKNGEPYRDYF